MDFNYISLGYILLLGAVCAVFLYLSRRSYGIFKPNGDIQILSVRQLSTKDKLVLVEVKGKEVLLGITSNQISHLLTLGNTSLTKPEDAQT